MKTWIITGGAASGKSTFSRLLQELTPGSHIYSSDEAVHEILAQQETRDVLSAEFGNKILGADGAIDRGALREVAFRNEETRLKLESLLHPRVFYKFQELRNTLLAEGKAELLIAEIPLLYETQSDYPADLVVLVAISPTLQRQRIVSTRSLTTEAADRILSAQLPLSRKLELADKVVWNEGDPALLKLQAQLLLNQ